MYIHQCMHIYVYACMPTFIHIDTEDSLIHTCMCLYMHACFILQVLADSGDEWSNRDADLEWRLSSQVSAYTRVHAYICWHMYVDTCMHQYPGSMYWHIVSFVLHGCVLDANRPLLISWFVGWCALVDFMVWVISWSFRCHSAFSRYAAMYGLNAHVFSDARRCDDEHIISTDVMGRNSMGNWMCD